MLARLEWYEENGIDDSHVGDRACDYRPSSKQIVTSDNGSADRV